MLIIRIILNNIILKYPITVELNIYRAYRRYIIQNNINTMLSLLIGHC